MNNFLKSFQYAFQGIGLALAGRNLRVQVFLAFLATAAGIFFQITRLEWVILFLCFGLVLSAEGFNTSLEQITDLIRDEVKVPYEDKRLANVKNVAAGAVLLTAICAAVIGIIIFWPYLLETFLR